MKAVLSLLVLTLAATLRAAAPSAAALDQLAADYFARQLSEALRPGVEAKDALRTQKEFVARLIPKLGQPVGYKVGLVTKEAQQKFGVTEPVRGVLLQRMLLPNGATVSAQFGARPVCEADLIVTVKDAGINQARTPLEIAQHLDEVVAFIELPDTIVSTNTRTSGPLFIAVNSGARLGVLGQRVKVRPTEKFVNALAEMTVTMSDQTGELGRAKGSLILDHPLNAVAWLLESLAATDEKLKPGDVISLGSLKAITPKAGQAITVRYDGLPGGSFEVSVKFE